MRKILIYIAIGLVSSIAAIAAYKKYTEDKHPIVYTNESPAKVRLVASDPTNLVGSAGIPDFTRAAVKGIDAVVSVKNYSNKVNNGIQNFDPFDFFFGFPNDFRGRQRVPEKNDRPKTGGSGVIIAPNGYIVTNNHVVEDADKIEVTLNDQRTYKAKLIGTDSNTDIALLKIEEKKELPFLYFSNSDNVQVGEWVLAVGNPFGLNSTVTAGIVSAKNRDLGILGGKAPIEAFVQTDAAVNPGNSGGALLNTKGELIGINTAIFSNSGAYEGYGFAVPCNLVEKVVKDLKQYGTVQRAFIGIEALDLTNEYRVREYNERFNRNIKPQQGIMVNGLSENSGAADTGIKKGDIIKEVEGQMIRNFADLSAVIGRKRPGDKVKIKALRDGKEKHFIVTLKDMKGGTKLCSKEEMPSSEWLGAKFEPLDHQSKGDFGINYGLRVTQLKRGRLSNLGIQEGDIILSINGKKVEKPADVDLLLKGYSGDVYIKLIKRNGQIVIRGFEMN
ncbi:MAG: Do family serine endopeptidase [Flavobacteriales bacterium AspAUS03]